MWLVGSILIGVFSHLLWDEFTHGNGIINNGWSFLHINLMLFNQQFPIHLALQVLSSVIGLVVLFWFIFKKPVNNSTYKVENKYYWLHFLLIALALIFFRFFIGEFNNSFWDMVVAFMGIGFYALLINALFQIFLEQIQARKEP